MKLCCTCKKLKDLSEFNKRSTAKDGHKPYCRVCASEANRKRYLQPGQKESSVARVADWRKSNPDARQREYLNNRETRIPKIKEWQQNNPDKVRVYKKNNKHRRRTATQTGIITPQEWYDLCAKYGGVCLRCKETKPLTMDHIVPLSKGGLHSIENIQPLCGRCNSIKHTKCMDYRTAS